MLFTLDEIALCVAMANDKLLIVGQKEVITKYTLDGRKRNSAKLSAPGIYPNNICVDHETGKIAVACIANIKVMTNDLQTIFTKNTNSYAAVFDSHHNIVTGSFGKTIIAIDGNDGSQKHLSKVLDFLPGDIAALAIEDDGTLWLCFLGVGRSIMSIKFIK